MNYYELVGLRKVFTAVHRSVIQLFRRNWNLDLRNSSQIISELLQPVPCFLNPVTDFACCACVPCDYRIEGTGYRDGVTKTTLSLHKGARM